MKKHVFIISNKGNLASQINQQINDQKSQLQSVKRSTNKQKKLKLKTKLFVNQIQEEKTQNKKNKKLQKTQTLQQKKKRKSLQIQLNNIQRQRQLRFMVSLIQFQNMVLIQETSLCSVAEKIQFKKPSENPEINLLLTKNSNQKYNKKITIKSKRIKCINLIKQFISSLQNYQQTEQKQIFSRLTYLKKKSNRTETSIQQLIINKYNFTKQEIQVCQQQFTSFINTYKLTHFTSEYQELKQLSLQQFISYLVLHTKRPIIKKIGVKQWTYQQQVSYIAFLKRNLSQLSKKKYKNQKLIIFHHFSSYLKVNVQRIYRHHGILLKEHDSAENIIAQIMDNHKITDQQVNEEIKNQINFETKFINHPLYSTNYSQMEKQKINSYLLKLKSSTSQADPNLFNALDFIGLINPSKKKIKQEWQKNQNIKFLIFIEANIHLFSMDLRKKKIKIIFQPMSKYIETKNSIQCLDHFNYLTDDRENVDEIIQNLYQKFFIQEKQKFQIKQKVKQFVRIENNDN